MNPAKPSLAAWLHSYNPSASTSHFQKFLTDEALARALDRVALAAAHFGEGGQAEVEGAQQKITHLRTSLSHLTAHLSSLTDRLASSQSALAALQLAHDRSTSTHAQELLAAKALCGVWEGRYREERRIREEAEEKLREELQRSEGRGRVLNGKTERRETELRVSQKLGLTPLPRPSRRRSGSSSSSSSNQTALPTSPRTHRSQRLKTPRSSKRGLLARLAHELEREKKDMRRILAEKDEEIARLAADQSARRAESQQLYSSLDTLLSLGAPVSTAAAVPLPAESADEVEVLSDPPLYTSRSHPYPQTSAAAPPSLLDHPSLAAAAKHSRSRARSTTGGKGELGETLRLEEEVRQLEREIARLGTNGAAHPDTSTLAEPDLSPDERQSLQSTIDDLGAQVERLQIELREAKNERAALKRVCDQYQNTASSTRHSQQVEEEMLHRVEELEAERGRLLTLLAHSESESTQLASQLSATHDSIDALSARVRRKLEEQRAKLDVAYRECEALRGECEAWEARCRELEAALDGA